MSEREQLCSMGWCGCNLTVVIQDTETLALVNFVSGQTTEIVLCLIKLSYSELFHYTAVVHVHD